MTRWLSPRFGAEAMFIVGVAVLLLLLEVGRAAVVAGVFAAWLVVVVLELASTRERPPDAPGAGRSAGAPSPPAPAEEPPPAAADPEQPVAGVEPFEPAPSPEPEAARQARAPVAGVEPFEPEPPPGAEPEPAEAQAETFPAPPPPPILSAVPSPEPEVADPEPPAGSEAGAEPEPEPEPEPDVVELHPGAPREWNLWELERLVRERTGADPVVDEERSYLLMYLREFAAPDGVLPQDFDPLVRESFADLLASRR